MDKVYIVLLIFLLTGLQLHSQKALTWKDFADVSFRPVYHEKYDAHFLMPTFGEKIRNYQGQKISIRGYFLDISGNGEVFLVSENPMASCFFCGAAGPETIVEVRFLKHPGFKTDDVVTVTGVLELNPYDVNFCNYILKDAIGILEK